MAAPSRLVASCKSPRWSATLAISARIAVASVFASSSKTRSPNAEYSSGQRPARVDEPGARVGPVHRIERRRREVQVVDHTHGKVAVPQVGELGLEAERELAHVEHLAVQRIALDEQLVLLHALGAHE